MKLLSLNDLMNELKDAVLEEKRLTLKIIDYVAEVSRRRAYLPKHTSMFAFLTEELGYCAGTAMLRINAIKALEVVPEAREKVENQKLSLNQLAKAQSFVTQENRKSKGSDRLQLSLVEQKQLFAVAESCSAKDLEEKLHQKTVEIEAERAKALGVAEPVARPFTKKVTIEVDSELAGTIEELKSLLSHLIPEGDLGEVLKVALPKAIKEIKIAKGLTKRTERAQPGAHTSAMKSKKIITRSIPTKVRREVWLRDQGQCQHVDPETQQKCLSRHQVQFDHLRPWSQRGDHSVENLQIRSAIHNRYRWESQNLQ